MSSAGWAARRASGGWDEDKHPRDERGRFISAGEWAGQRGDKANAKRGATFQQLGIAHSLDKDSRRVVEGAIARGGYERYLKDHPLGRVEEHSIEESHNNAVYARPKRAEADLPFISIKDAPGFEVAHARSQRIRADLGRKAAIGSDNTFTVSTLAKTPEAMRERTMVHELGHHIHLDVHNPLPSDLMTRIAQAYNRRVGADKKTVPGKFVVSMYARDNHKEWFAETHAAYVYHGAALKKKDPEAYALVRDVRKARGLE